MAEAEQVCRTCLKQSDDTEEYIDLNTIHFPHQISLRLKLKSCVPEMVIGEKEKAVICTSCMTLLESSYVFRKMCLNTENKLHQISSEYYTDLVKIINKKPSTIIKNERSSSLSVGENKAIRGPKRKLSVDEIIHFACQKLKLKRTMLDCTVILEKLKLVPERFISKGDEPVSFKKRPGPKSKTMPKEIDGKNLTREPSPKVKASPPKGKAQPPKANTLPPKPKARAKRKLTPHHCQYCYKRFSRPSHARDHEQRIHLKITSFHCRLCKRGFYTNHELKNHMKHHQAGVKSAQVQRRSLAPLPPREVKRARKSYAEVSSDESESPSKKKDEGPNLDEFGMLADALTSVNEYKMQAEKTLADLAVNVKEEKTVEQKFTCTLCNSSFSTEEERDAHSQTHINYGCNLCSILFGSSEERDEHVKLHFNCEQGKFCCLICNITVKHKDHFNIHTGNRPYICKLCDKGFANSSTLRQHMFTHGVPKPYNCDKCKKGFIKLSILRQHRESCLTNKPVKPRPKYIRCSVCKKKYSQGTFDSHVCQNERGERVFTCHICKESITGRSMFIDHVKRHFVESAEKDKPNTEEIPATTETGDSMDIDEEIDLGRETILETTDQNKGDGLTLKDLLREAPSGPVDIEKTTNESTPAIETTEPEGKGTEVNNKGINEQVEKTVESDALTENIPVKPENVNEPNVDAN